MEREKEKEREIERVGVSLRKVKTGGGVRGSGMPGMFTCALMTWNAE
jgi:hypothetical protein